MGNMFVQILSFYALAAIICTFNWMAGALRPVIVNDLQVGRIILTTVDTAEWPLLTTFTYVCRVIFTWDTLITFVASEMNKSTTIHEVVSLHITTVEVLV